MRSFLAITAFFPAGATLYFFVFWRGFAFWRRHQVATYAMMIGTFAAIIAASIAWSDELFGWGLDLPAPVRAIGWALIAAALALGFVADRQIGLRVRSFTPFFEEHGRIDLVTTGAYAIVRHPIYAAGIWYQAGVLLVTGAGAVAAALVVLATGATWFTRQEERRLRELLDDPAAYDAYRTRVPALAPWPRPRATA